MLAYAFGSNLYALIHCLLHEWPADPSGTVLFLLELNFVPADVVVATAVWMFSI